jgi:glyoxylase-like metal-dependent hydrolase (beta-lactamase superfamily II)/rhodanese-related sulfurtransferase
VPELVVPVVDEGLGNSAYLVDLGDGRALAVDVSRDLRALDAAAGRRGLRVVAAADTHLHADFLSGATRLAARDGAAVYGSAAGGRAFPHRGFGDGDEVDLGGLVLRAWATPGHTGEHVAYLLLDGDRPLAAFTGGSLLVGAAARTDLVSPDQTEALARAQHASLRRLAALPDDTLVLPTHGAGSFCSAPPGAERTSTIGREKATNPYLAEPDEDAFVQRLLGSLGSFPPYFLRLAEVNRLGPPEPGEGGLAPLGVAEVLRLKGNGAVVVDVRPPADWAAGHLPGALANTLRPAFATWLGWLVADPGTPIVVVRNPEQDPDEVVWQARKVGYDRIAGELAGGVEAWRAAGQEVASARLVAPEEVDPEQVLDVRQAAEFAGGHLPGARHVELGVVAGTPVSPGPVVTMCGHGERAASAASVLERLGHRDLGILAVGPGDWAAATGRPVVTGA